MINLIEDHRGDVPTAYIQIPVDDYVIHLQAFKGKTDIYMGINGWDGGWYNDWLPSLTALSISAAIVKLQAWALEEA